MKTLGGLEILVNNAGIINESDFTKTIDVNVVSNSKNHDVCPNVIFLQQNRELRIRDLDDGWNHSSFFHISVISDSRLFN